MTFKEKINERRKSAAATFHKFRTDSSIHSRRHYFVEGYEDVKFYARHIPKTAKEAPRFHVCFGKKNLDEVAKLYWSSDITSSTILFIRDSDFDHFLGRAPSGRDLFLTCGYAVENYVCSAVALERYFSLILCVDEAEVSLDDFVTRYVSLADRFHQWLSPLYGATMVALSAGRKIDLNQLNVALHFSKLLCGIDPENPLEMAELAKIGLEKTDFNEDAMQLGVQFAKLPALQWLRGKYLLTIATSFIRSKEAECRLQFKAGNITRFNVKAVSGMTEEGIFDTLSSWAEPTTRLITYLNGTN